MSRADHQIRGVDDLASPGLSPRTSLPTQTPRATKNSRILRMAAHYCANGFIRSFRGRASGSDGSTAPPWSLVLAPGRCPIQLADRSGTYPVGLRARCCR